MSFGYFIFRYFHRQFAVEYIQNEIVNNTWHINRKDFEVKQR